MGLTEMDITETNVEESVFFVLLPNKPAFSQNLQSFQMFKNVIFAKIIMGIK